MNARSAAFRAISSWPTPEDPSWPAREDPYGTTREDTSEQTHEEPGNRLGRVGVGIEKNADEWGRWAGAVNRMAGGDYAGAWMCFADLARSDNTEIAGLACAARASGLRQLGAHAEAVDLDDEAIATRGVALLDGLIGRAADESGLGDSGRCRHYLAQADRMLSTTHEQQLRGRTRIGWVAAESALMQGVPAVAPAQRAVAAAQALGSPRHVLKSLLIRGVAMRAVGDPAGDAELLRVLRSADELGIRTLVWPAALALEDGLPAGLRQRAATAVAYIRSHLPPGRFDGWDSATDQLAVGG